MLLNLYTTWNAIENIQGGKKDIAYAKKYVNAEHVSITVDTEEYSVVKQHEEDMFIIERRKHI